MLQDNLTQRLKQELANRGVAVSDEKIQNYVQSYMAKQMPNMYSPVGEKKQAQNNSVLNAVGVGLWSALDTAAFGVPGAFVEEEEYLDFSTTGAKWLGAIGGMAGFIGGAPVKIGAKVVQKIAGATAIKSLGKQSLSAVTKDMSRRALKSGVSKKTSREVVKKYKQLVHRAQTDRDLASSEVWQKSVTSLLTKYTDDAIAMGKITEKEAVAVKSMFEKVYDRPLQDFIGVMMERGLAKTNPILARVVGHAMNDVLMFSMIDGVFEGVSTIEDHEYDWTAPIWGAVNGVAFSQISWLKPVGKSSKWLPDFRAGVRSVFTKASPYEKMPKEQLVKVAKFYGGVRNKPVIEIAGKKLKLAEEGVKKTVRLKDENLIEQLDEMFGKENVSSVLKAYLDKSRKEVGKEMMLWATKDSAKNVMKNWKRMALGGILFNTHTFADMFLHEYEPTLDDILPHFFIGAFMQLGRNPAEYDFKLGAKKINQLRTNLATLGFDTGQLRNIPSFGQVKSSFKNPFHAEKYKPLLKMAEEEGIFSSVAEVTDVPLKQGEVSAEVKQNSKFNRIYDELKEFGYATPKDNISAETARRIVKEFEKVAKATKLSEYDAIFEEASIESTKDLEREVHTVIEELRLADERGGEKQAEISVERDNILKTPNILLVSEEIKKQARKGEIDWLVNEDGTVMSGEKAVDELMSKFNGYSGIVLAAELTGQASVNQVTPTKTVTSLTFAKDVYSAVTKSEGAINRAFPNNMSYAEKFTYDGSIHDYLEVVGRNAAIKIGHSAVNIFSPENSEVRAKMFTKLREAGLVQTGEAGVGEPLLINDISKIKFVDWGDIPEDMRATKEGEYRRVLGRVLALQSLSGGFRRHEQVSAIEVGAGKVESLVKYLKEDNKFPIDTMSESLMTDMRHFILRDKIKKSNVTISEAESIFNLAEVGFGGFDMGKKGEHQGFYIHLIDENLIPAGQKRFAQEYNRIANSIINKSNGLVVKGDTRSLLEADSASLLLQKIQTDPAANAKAAEQLLGFVNEVAGIGNINLNRMLGEYITTSTSVDKLTTWLLQAGVLEYKEGKKFEYNYNLKKFNTEVQQELQRWVVNQGFSNEYVQNLYETDKQLVRNILEENNFLKAKDEKYDANRFFEEYNIDGRDFSIEDPAVKRDMFNELLYTAFAEKTQEGKAVWEMGVSSQLIPNLLKRISVKTADGKYVEFTALSKDVRNKWKKKIVRDALKLIGGVNNQHRINTIKYENGRIVESDGWVQRTKLNALLEEKLGLPVTYVDKHGLILTPSWDGKHFVRKQVNLFGDSFNLDAGSLEVKQIQEHRSIFKQNLNLVNELSGELVQTGGGSRGIELFQMGKDMSPIAVATQNLHLITPHFAKLEAKVAKVEGVDSRVRTQFRELKERLGRDTPVARDYELALMHLVYADMFMSNNKVGKKFTSFLNGEKIEKSAGRVQLYNNKNFIKYDRDIIHSYMRTYLDELQDRQTANALGKIFKQNGFNIMVWDDDTHNNARKEVVKRFGITEKKLNNIIGDAHKDVSGYDSISFVSKGQMRFMHAMLGHDPNSKNPIKPAIASGGENTLLMGKTLLVYDEALDPFFRKNSSVDILMSSSAAKAFDGVKLGMSIENVSSIKGLARLWNPDKYITHIPIEALGLKPKIDKIEKAPTKSTADYNYAGREEVGRLYEAEGYAGELEAALRQMTQIVEHPRRMREFMLSMLGQEGLPTGEGAVAQMNNMMYFLANSPDANPSSLSKTQVKKRLYSQFIHNLLHNRKGQLAEGGLIGGQADIIQTVQHRLRPTIMNSDGTMEMRGEIMLPSSAKNISINDMIKEGNEIVFVENKKTFTPEEIFGKEVWKGILSENLDLGVLFEGTELQGSKDLRVGIMTNRKPRTRPNDMAILGLKGFLSENYGKSIAVNSFDVINIFEGDYDADKVDFFVGHKKAMWDHVKRTQDMYVQGIDPSSLQTESTFSWADNSKTVLDNLHNMGASADLAKQAIGTVQKVPRMLQYLAHLAEVNSKDEVISKLIRQEGLEKAPKVLLYTPDGGRIIMEFDNTNYYERAALEAQYMIDIQGGINKELMRDVRDWKSSFLFPRIDDGGLTFSEMKKRGISHVNNMIGKKQVSNRAKIFTFVNKEGKRDTRELSLAEQKIIQQMMSEYGKFLNIAGDKTYSTEGVQESMSYDAAFGGAKAFAQSHANLSETLYYKLRRQKIPGTTKKWHEDVQFNAYFSPEPKQYEVWENNKKVTKTSYKAQRDIFNAEIETDVHRNALRVADGQLGSVADRILIEFFKRDIFNDNVGKYEKESTLSIGDKLTHIDDWYNLLMAGADEAYHTQNLILKNVQNFNSAVYAISSLKKKIASLGYQKNLTWKAKETIKAQLNEKIEQVEEKLRKYLPQEHKYFQTRKSADLSKYHFTPVEGREVVESAIQYHTMKFIGDNLHVSLSKSAQKDLQMIKDIRKAFYANNGTFKEILQYGSNTILESAEMDYLKQSPDINTFYEVESKLLYRGIAKYGFGFLHKFMELPKDNYNIGVFANRPVEMPYGVSARYRRGYQFLTTIAKDPKAFSEVADINNQRTAQEILTLYQQSEGHYEKFFNKRIDENTNIDPVTHEYRIADFRLPGFGQELTRKIGDFSEIRWNKGDSYVKNDNLMRFYNDLLAVKYGENIDKRGVQKEFADYISVTNDLKMQMAGNGTLDPIRYLATRATIDGEIKQLMHEVFVSGEYETNTVAYQKLLSNPITVLNGLHHLSASGREGISFESKFDYSINKVKERVRIANEMDRINETFNVSSEASKTDIASMIEMCGG